MSEELEELWRMRVDYKELETLRMAARRDPDGFDESKNGSDWAAAARSLVDKGMLSFTKEYVGCYEGLRITDLGRAELRVRTKELESAPEEKWMEPTHATSKEYGRGAYGRAQSYYETYREALRGVNMAGVPMPRHVTNLPERHLLAWLEVAVAEEGDS